MNGKILKKYKLDERYVLSERKFLYTFGYLCMDKELLENKKLTKKQLYYFLEQRLNPASDEEVNYASVATGNIILVGRPNQFRAYYRPVELKETDIKHENLKLEKEDEKDNAFLSLAEMNLSALLKKYYENDDNDTGILYLEEVLSRIKISPRSSEMELARRYKTKIKYYRKKVDSHIDK